MKLLGISEIMLKKYGAVSKEVAKSMADGVRKLLNVDIGISTTGIAGPTGGTKEKPRLYLSLSREKQTNWLKIVKAKNRRDGKFNPDGLRVSFKLVNGFHLSSDLQWEREK